MSDDAGSSIMEMLPQPKNGGAYSYVLYEELESRYFSSPLPVGTLCWTLKSKGVKKGGHGARQQRTQLFSRARVISTTTTSSDEEEEEDHYYDRVLVRYSKGSSYHVRRSNLIPILEHTTVHYCCDDKIVLVTPETPQYRRACVVHTYRESFLEIGCDFGITIDRVQASLVVGGSVARITGAQDVPIDDDKPRFLGIDKSPESIDIARKRYPKSTFLLADVFDDNGKNNVWDLVQKELGGPPCVVAIDINGNRELPAVLKCVDRVLNSGQEPPPRLVIVKSRFLHAKLLEEKNKKKQSRQTT